MVSAISRASTAAVEPGTGAGVLLVRLIILERKLFVLASFVSSEMHTHKKSSGEDPTQPTYRTNVRYSRLSPQRTWFLT